MRGAGNVHLQPFHRVLSASLSRRFPEAIAEAGDTVGLTIDTLRDVERGASALVLLCVDLTEQVLSEAASARAHFVVTYSPMPHSPFTTLSTDDVLGRIVLGCAKHQIAVHSVHSACDAASGGVNAWLARSLARGVVRPIVKHPKVADAGQGRVLECDEATPISTVVERLKALLGVRFLRLALAAVVAPEALAKAQEFLTVKTVAVGEGATLLRGWTGDLLITSEMSHADVVAANAQNVNVILTGQSTIERAYLQYLRQELESEFADSDWNVLFKCSTDCNPLSVV